MAYMRAVMASGARFRYHRTNNPACPNPACRGVKRWNTDAWVHQDFSVPAIELRHGHIWRRRSPRALGQDRRDRGAAAGRHLPRCRRLDVRHRRRLFARRVRTRARRSHQGPARQGADFDQGDFPLRRRTERYRLLTPAPAEGDRRLARADWAPTISTCSSFMASTR